MYIFFLSYIMMIKIGPPNSFAPGPNNCCNGPASTKQLIVLMRTAAWTFRPVSFLRGLWLCVSKIITIYYDHS